jgi:DNA-directed RNA polymerase sigma subunit (sigma70/sigma32)
MTYPTETQRNKAILEKYLGGETLAEIGRAFGITRQRIHQIINATSLEDNEKIDKIVHRVLNRKSKRASN